MRSVIHRLSFVTLPAVNWGDTERLPEIQSRTSSSRGDKDWMARGLGGLFEKNRALAQGRDTLVKVMDFYGVA